MLIVQHNIYIRIYNEKAHKSGWNCMMVWSWHAGRQCQKHCMFDVEPKLSHNEFVVCPPTIYNIILEMLISKYSGQDACCLHVLMDCIFQEHCLAQTDGSWTLKLGPLAIQLVIQTGCQGHPLIFQQSVMRKLDDAADRCKSCTSTSRGSFKLRNK